ncbi:Reticulocyte-binding protein 2-like protein a [Oryzias melastigma]|uniref:Reticulocyte-binding protein 2-like protein a n=1 Tax=Oryzias melastigma TaxID=30732 RepID=A0A834BYF5_ORYME|nr:Reticulocyte-binding protein 2-like protein a [Oryzias melastigma]
MRIEEEKRMEELRRQREEEERIEEMRRKEEEDMIRRQKEQEEIRRKEEEELLRRQEEEKQKEYERKKREDEMRKKEEEDRARKQKEIEEMKRKEEEEMLRRQEELERELEEERLRLEEEAREAEKERLKREEEERIRVEEEIQRKEEERRLKELERLRLEEEERMRREEQERIEEKRRREDAEKARKEKEENERCDPALVSEGSRPVSCEETDPIRTQREKRPAPRPPGSDQDGSQRWKAQDVAEQAQINKLNPESDVKTGNVVSARLMKKIPQGDSKNTQSSTPTSEVITAKHGKRPAPTRPQPAAKDSSELKTISSAGKIPQMGATEKEQVLPIHGLNPFEDELSDQEDSSVSAPVCWPPALTADGVKLKSSKMARAPAPPAKR